MRIVFQRCHLGRGFLEVLAQKVGLRDSEGDAAGVGTFGKFCLIILEGGDRLRIIAGIKIGRANCVKNRLDLRSDLDPSDQRF